MGSLPPLSAGEARPARVLLVDDNPDLVNITERVLKRSGMLVECAWDGLTAADLVRRTEFDVVVSDVAMTLETWFATEEPNSTRSVLLVNQVLRCAALAAA